MQTPALIHYAPRLRLGAGKAPQLQGMNRILLMVPTGGSTQAVTAFDLS